MDFIRRLLEQKVAAAIGQPVTLGSLSVSPLSGSVEIRDLAVGTMLRVKRVQAKISLARAMKQEIVVKSLTIESPQITLDGPPPRPPAKPSGSQAKSAWSFEAEHVLVVDGTITFRDPRSGYMVSIEKLDGSVKRPDDGNGFEYFFAAPSSGRRDQMVELGPAKMWGTFTGEAINGRVQVGSVVNLKASTAAMKNGPWMGSMEIVAAVELILRLLPPQVKMPISGVSGNATLVIAVTVDQAKGVIVDRFSINTDEAKLRLA